MRGALATGVTITWRQSSGEFGGTGGGYVGAHGFKGFGKKSIIAIGGKWGWTRYLYDINLETSV